MRSIRRRSGPDAGFTLIEVLVAMSLVGAVLLPSCLWLYQSRTSRAAMERFRAVQALEAGMNRAWLLRQVADSHAETPGADPLRIDIHPVRDGAEIRLLGTASNRKGRIVTRLQAGFFEEAP